ncbi:hypothetical protein OSTOST_22220, partial [Ostertagia ostertagi]
EESDYAERGWEEDELRTRVRGLKNEQHGEENIFDYEQQIEGGGMENDEGSRKTISGGSPSTDDHQF